MKHTLRPVATWVQIGARLVAPRTRVRYSFAVVQPKRAALFAAWIGISAAATGCRTPTSITLSITTDVQCKDLHGVAIVSGSRDTTETAPPATTTTQCADQGDGTSRIGTLVVVPSSATDAEIAVRIVAGVDRPVEECSASTSYAGCIVARRWLRFEPHTELTLPIELHLDCKSVACNATSTCVHAGCQSPVVTNPGSCSGDDCLSSGDASVDVGADASDAGADVVLPVDGGCGAGQKNCGGMCVAVDDPNFGCGTASCSPCDPSTHQSYSCGGGTCTATGCAAGYKSCGGGACQPIDAAHGCSAAACTACPATNGVASCDMAGKCQLTCNTGYKLCGGACVNIGDPTYGCGATTCDNSSCPKTGTVVCSGSSCVLGSCGPGTKACGGACVPTDTTHGCGDTARCTACAAGESCVGGPPTTCSCVDEAKSITCSKVQCGVTTNNCGHSVDCGNTCTAPNTCGGGGTANVCGCTSSGSPCDGISCGTLSDSCGKSVSCGCTGSNTCGGGGTAGKCGCTPTNPCTGGKCGTFADGCGGSVTCNCTAPNTCGGGGVAGVCGCTPDSKGTACVGQVCGSAPDGCGGFINCGTCAGKCCGPGGYECVCAGCTCGPIP